MQFPTTLQRMLRSAGLSAAALFAAGSATDALAQRQVVIESGITLVETILGDTTATGQRVDVNTKYILRRGGFYLLMGSIDHRFPLTIEAEPGDGPRPILQPAVLSGGLADQPFRNRANMTLKGVQITGEDELGGITLRIFRVSEPNVTITLEDSHIDQSGQAAFRLDSPGATVNVFNSVISNMGTPDSRENGRVIDDRGQDIDSLVIVNSTFYNITAQVIRDDGGITNYARINGNTMVNVGMQTLELGPTREAIIQNNILVNPGFYGIDNDNDVNATIQVLPVAGESQSVTIRNNNIYHDPALAGAYPGGFHSYIVFNATAQAAIDAAGAGSTITSVAVPFTNGPASPTEVVSAFHSNPGGVQPRMPNDGAPFNFGYASSLSVYTGGTSGQPLGDRNWLPGVSTSIDNDKVELAGAFRLVGNYPNPFNPSTTLRFEMPQAGSVTLEVYDALGRMVQTVDLGRFQAGMNQVAFNADRLSSGVYLARMISGNQVSSLKMTLVK